MDHFSRLPDHLHVFILLKLGTKAVKTSGLSRQWRRIWIQVPVLNFDGVDCGVTRDALAAYQAHGEGDIQSLTVSPNANELNAEDTTAWTSIAAPLLSGTLYLDNRRTVTPERLGVFLNDDGGEVRRTGTFHLPCFERATELWLDVGFLGLSLPPVGVFDALGVLWLANFWCPGEFSISHAILPSLQELTISRVRGLAVLTVNSESLHYLHLSSSPELQNLSILAPQLISLEVASCLYVPASVANVVAENLKILRWEVQCRPELAEMSSLLQLQAPAIDTFWSELVCSEFLSCFSSIYHLELQISLGVSVF